MTIHKEIVSFSEAIREKLKVSKETLKVNEGEGVVYKIGNFKIVPVSRAWNDFEPILEVVPANDKVPEDWHLVKRGYFTEVLPDEKTRASILKAVQPAKPDNEWNVRNGT